MSEHEAGHELDALVAEKVFGYRWEGQPKDYDGNYGGEPVLLPPGETWETMESVLPRRGRIAPNGFIYRYSTDFAAAWRVVEELRPRFWTKIGVGLHIDTGARLHEVAMGRYAEADKPSEQIAYRRGTDLPLAICLAALAAVTAEVPADV